MDIGVVAVKRIIIIAAAVTLASAGSALAGNYGGGHGGGCGSSCGGGYGGSRNYNSNVNVNVNANANSYASSYAASSRSLIQARGYSGYGQQSIGGGGYVSVSEGYYGGGDIGGYGGGLQLAADCGCVAGVSAPFGYPVSGFGRRLVSQRGSYASYYAGGPGYGYAPTACCAPAPVAAPCCTQPIPAGPVCGPAYGGGYGNRYGSRGGACNTYAPPPPPPAYDCNCEAPVYAQPVYAPPPPIYLRQQGVRVASPPVNIPPQVVYVQGPPVWVDAPPVNVAPPQIYLEQPNIRVRPSEVNVAPPEIHFVPAQDRPEEDCCSAVSGPVEPVPYMGEADHEPRHPRSGPDAYVDGAPVPAYRNEREAAEYFQ